MLFCIFWQGKPLTYTVPGLCGGKFTYNSSKRHFFDNKTNNCADSNFSLKETPKVKNCSILQSDHDSHGHEKISEDSLQYAVVCWGFLLRFISMNGKESVAKSVEYVLSTWPQNKQLKLGIPDDQLIGLIQIRLSHKKWIFTQSKNNKSNRKFLSDFSQDNYENFRTFACPEPIPVHKQGNPS